MLLTSHSYFFVFSFCYLREGRRRAIGAMPPKWRFFTKLTVFLFLLCMPWQYCIYKEDRRRLEKESTHLQTLYASLEQSPLIREKINNIDLSIEQLAAKIPIGDYNNEAFLRSLRTICLLNGTIYQLLNKKYYEHPFYSMEQFHFKIHGRRNSVQNTVMEIEKMNRLINWDTICLSQPLPHSQRVELHFSLKIYHLNPITPQRKQYVRKPNLEVKTWMPPFSYKLGKIKNDAETTYEVLAATPNVENLIHFVKEYAWKNDRLQQMTSLENQLEATRTELLSFLKELPICLSK